MILQTDDGDLVLRREGGNAFSDPALEELVGQRIRGEGLRTDYTLILKEWEIVTPAGPPNRPKARKLG